MDCRYYLSSVTRRMAAFLLLLLLAPVSHAQQQFTSSAAQTQLIELYTSEGCSSCPPADQWLSRFTSAPDLWQRVIPIAFHVDYWDYIGWPDRFASPAFAQRQRLHKKQRNTRAVYTPGFVVNGKEWKGWWANKQAPHAEQQPGVLSITLDDKNFAAGFAANDANNSPQQLTVAIVGFDITTAVQAGENRGELLNHNFVVLAIDRFTGEQQWQGKLPVVEQPFNASRFGLVAWVSDEQSLVPVQAVGGWLD
jgi:hypothetical protein